jgi:putative oxidoreductase
VSIDTASPVPRPGKVKAAAVWTVSVLLAALFLFAGSMKFLRAEAAAEFAELGYADWFRVLIGVVEIVAGLALVVPRTAFWAAGALAVVMVGAVVTLVRLGKVGEAVVPFVVLVLLILVGYVRRPGASA